MRFAICLFLLLFAAVGCREAPTTPAAGSSRSPDPNELRIVSLSPAISRTLVDLELDHLIVGRTPFCDSLERSVPVVGDLHDLDYETLIRVRPTHVFVQPPASGVQTRLVQLSQERKWALHMWRLERMEDIAGLIGDLPAAVYGENYEEQSKALSRSLELIEQLIALQHTPNPLEPVPPRTMLLVGVDPVTAFGSETYLHEILLMVGGRNAADHSGYPQYTLEDVARMNPQQIVLVRPGASNGDRAAFGPILQLDVDAVRNDRLAILTHPDALLPSSGVIGVAEELRSILRQFGEGEDDQP